MTSTGTVRTWDAESGWGVLDSPDTPGGCWTHAGAVDLSGTGDPRPLSTGRAVRFEHEAVAHDGFAFRAVRVVPVPVEPVRVIRPHELTGADPTSGMSRELAFESGLLWSGRVTTAPGAVSGWHHHDLNTSSLYVVRGVLRLEVEGIAGHLDAHAGDFVQVPSFTVHRESNPTDEPSIAVIARAGGGTPTVNVEHAPAPHAG